MVSRAMQNLNVFKVSSDLEYTWNIAHMKPFQHPLSRVMFDTIKDENFDKVREMVYLEKLLVY